MAFRATFEKRAPGLNGRFRLIPPLFCSRSCKDSIRRKICKSDCRPNKLFFLLLFLLLSKKKRYGSVPIRSVIMRQIDYQ